MQNVSECLYSLYAWLLMLKVMFIEYRAVQFWLKPWTLVEVYMLYLLWNMVVGKLNYYCATSI